MNNIAISSTIFSTVLFLASCCPSVEADKHPQNAKNPAKTLSNEPHTARLVPRAVWKQPKSPSIPEVSIVDIEEKMDLIGLKAHGSNIIVLKELPTYLYGTSLVKPSHSSQVVPVKTIVIWKPGQIVKIRTRILIEGVYVHRDFVYCDGKPCYVAQTEVANDSSYEIKHAAYFSGDKELKRIDTKLKPLSKDKPIAAVPKLFQKLKAEAIEKYTHISKNILPMVTHNDYFIDNSVQAKRLKKIAPYAVVSQDALVIGKDFNFLADLPLMKMNPRIDVERGLVVADVDEALLPEKGKAKQLLSFLPKKPFILYNYHGHTKKVHIKQLQVVASFPYGTDTTNISLSKTLATAPLYLMATTQEPLLASHYWSVGHYAGFGPLEFADNDDNLAAPLKKKFIQKLHSEMWKKNYDSHSFSRTAFSSDKYTFFFSRISKGAMCAPSYNEAHAIYAQDRHSGRIFDWTEQFDAIDGISFLPDKVLVDSDDQSIVMLFFSSIGPTHSRMILYRDHKLILLPNLPSAIVHDSECSS